VLVLLMGVSVPPSAQGPDGSRVLDSLRAAINCPEMMPVIHHEEWDVPAADACILVATALREFARYNAELSEFTAADTGLVSEASVYVETAKSNSGMVLEAAWRVLLEIRDNPYLFWMTIDLRTGRIRFGAMSRPTGDTRGL